MAVARGGEVQGADEAPTRYAWYVAALLLAVNTTSYIDRKMPFILVEPIKHDLALSDTQIGLITGLAFALFYGAAGIPLASLADKGNRARILAFALAAWGGLTSLGGFAQNFWHLCSARIGVAASESVGTPCSHSLLADYFPSGHRARVIALYTIGPPLGIFLGLSLGGLINQFLNWRIAMFLLGVPGLLLAVLVHFTLREPPRKVAADAAQEPAPRMVDAVRAYLREPMLIHLWCANVLFATSSSALQVFAPAFIMRTFGLPTGEIGVTYGLLAGVAGTVGAMAGGQLGDRVGLRRALICGAAVVGLSAPVLVFGLFSHSYPLFLVGVFAVSASVYMTSGPMYAVIQRVLPSRMHAVGTAITLLGVNGVAMSIGPVVTGAISDGLGYMKGGEGLKWALVVSSAPILWSAVHFLLAARWLTRDGVISSRAAPSANGNGRAPARSLP